jgi:myo-inositol-1(or 4)-monophosphatase
VSFPEPFSVAADFKLALACELRAAFEAAEAGAQVVMDYFRRGVEMRQKAGGATCDLVSDADLQSEQAIAKSILAAFPGHAILGEEEHSGSAHAENLWIIDPLDGTNNFAHRIPHFAVSIAYYHRGQAMCGVVVNPVRGDWYWASRGGGAFHNGRRLAVSSETSLAETMVGVGFYYDRGAMMEATLASIHAFFKQQIHGVRRFGAAALDLCQVADGMFGLFFEYQLSPWDFAAGRLILEEAGGKITDGRGNPLAIATSSVLASNTHLHAAALEIVSRNHL